jgi:hypothetical protein
MDFVLTFIKGRLRVDQILQKDSAPVLQPVSQPASQSASRVLVAVSIYSAVSEVWT